MANVAIIGAGPAGLTAAYHLAKHGVPVKVLEADEWQVGGISRTINYKGFRFDTGGHRFSSQSDRVAGLWKEILGDEMIEEPRSSRILFGGRLYSYPLKPVEVLMNLGLAESGRCGLSYLKARAFPEKDPRSLEDWVTNQFGSRLFRILFKTYTEKVWGMRCKEISADWAVRDGVHCPRLGPGMMWERCAERVRRMGGEILMGHEVSSCSWNSEVRQWRVECRTAGGESKVVQASHIVSSAPLKEFVASLRPVVSGRTLYAAQSLRYRDMLTVGLILPESGRFAANWIDVHEPSLLVGRIRNYKSWSLGMAPDPAYTCYGLEYFCNRGPGLWSFSDEDLIALAKKELEQAGLARAADVVDGCVIRQPKAYPVYHQGYAAHVATIREELQENYPTLHLVGRNGMHRFLNQDQAIKTALLSADDILTSCGLHNVGDVNQDAGYPEPGPECDQQEVCVGQLVPGK